MIVWGGADGSVLFQSGGRYDPATDSWRATSIGNDVPSPRRNHTALWTGTEMVVWGGNPSTNTGGRYDPVSDSWRPTFIGSGVPTQRLYHTAVWTGTEMIISGGFPLSGTGFRYDPATDGWRSTQPIGAAESSWSSAIWTGEEMIIWGGTNLGARYNPTTDSWFETSTTGSVPDGRLSHSAVWTGTEMIVWGGNVSEPSGGRYCVCGDWYLDNGGDGAGTSDNVLSSCSRPIGYAAKSGDCDDSDPLVHPGAEDICNGIDDNCNLLVDDDDLGQDTDGDGIVNSCDNCREVGNPTQADIDSDEEGDICDLDDGMIYMLFHRSDYVEWQEEAGFDSWNSYRGDLQLLRDSQIYTQDPLLEELAERTCGTQDPWVADADPPLGRGTFFLTTGMTGLIESSLGVDSAGSARINTSPCP